MRANRDGIRHGGGVLLRWGPYGQLVPRGFGSVSSLACLLLGFDVHAVCGVSSGTSRLSLEKIETTGLKCATELVYCASELGSPILRQISPMNFVLNIDFGSGSPSPLAKTDPPLLVRIDPP